MRMGMRIDLVNEKGNVKGMNLEPDIGGHEVAHGVMLWLLGLPATALHCSDSGGLCEFKGSIFPHQNILFTLAGFAYEADGGEVDLDNSKSQDFDEARALLADNEYLRMRVAADGKTLQLDSSNDALKRWLLEADKMLQPHAEFIARIGFILEDEGWLSARRFGAFLREYGKRLEGGVQSRFV